MFRTALERLEAGIGEVVAYATTNDSIRAQLGDMPEMGTPTSVEARLLQVAAKVPASAQWKVMDHCAAIGRLYALYEQYAESVLSDWLSFRRQDLKFSELPEELQGSYRIGFAEVLGSLSEAKYSHLSFDAMVTEYSKSSRGEVSYTLYPECLIYHRNNLRLAELTAITGRCEAGDFGHWLADSRDIAGHFESKKKLTELSESKLKDFVQYRNDAAHGGIATDEIMGLQQIGDLADFLLALCRSYNQMIDHTALNYMIEREAAHKIGMVSEVYSGNIVVGIVEGTALRVGDRIATLTEKSCHYHSIVSLQLDNRSVDHVEVANSREVGFGLSSPALNRAKLVTIPGLVRR